MIGTVSKLKFHLCLRTIPPLGLESWMVLISTLQKSMLTKKERGHSFGEARPRQKPTVTLTSVSVLVLERRWVDIETQRSHDQKCFEVSKAITRLLRHDQTVPRGSEGAIQYSDIIEECRKKFDGASQWPLEDWISTLAKGREAKKRFQYCVNPNSSNQFLYFRAIQGHSGKAAVDPAWQRQCTVTERIHRVHLPRREREWVEFHNKKRTNSRRKSLNRGRQAVFFTTVNPMDDEYGMGETPCDLPKQGSRFTRILGNAFKIKYFGAVDLYNTLLAACIEKAENNSGWAPPEGSLNSESATSRAEIELAIWSTKSRKPRRKIILGTIERFEKVTEKSVTTPCITEFLEYLFLLSNNGLQHARTKSRGWSRSSRTPSIRNHSFRTWARRRRSTSSAKNRKTWSPTWTTPRSSIFAKILPNSNVLSAIHTEKSV